MIRSETMTTMTMTRVIHHLVLSKNVLPTTNIFIIICSSSFSSSSHDFLVHFRPIHKYYKYDKQSSRRSSRFKYYNNIYYFLYPMYCFIMPTCFSDLNYYMYCSLIKSSCLMYIFLLLIDWLMC